LADIHIDFFYQEGSEVNCGKTLCCRDYSNDTTTEKAGFWGTISRCDIPVHTV